MFDGRDPLYVQIADQIRVGRAVRSPTSGGAGHVDDAVRDTLPHQPGDRRQGVQGAGRRRAAVQARGLGMFVAAGARERLLAQRRASFFADLVDPMLEQARGWASRSRRSSSRLRATEGPR